MSVRFAALLNCQSENAIVVGIFLTESLAKFVTRTLNVR